MSVHQHRWAVFDRAEVGTGPNDRVVRLPRRMACSRCGVTMILEADLTNYPHVAQAIIDDPKKVVGL